METIELRVIYNRKKQLNKKGEGLVQIEAYQNGLRKYFSTGVKVTPAQWKPKPNKDIYVSDSHLNLLIVNKKAHLRKYRDTFVAIHGSMKLSDFDGFKDVDSGSRNKVQLTFFDFYEEQLKVEKSNVKFITWSQQRRNLLLMRECFADGLTFEQLTYSAIEKYDQFLKKRKGRGGKMKLNSVAKRHRQTLKFVKIAIKKGYLRESQNPYLTFERKTETVNKEYLTKEERQRVEQMVFEPHEKLIEMARDMFLFSCYTGLRYSDIHGLTDSNFTENEKGLRLSFVAQKTQKALNLPLYSLFDGKPQVIAQKYIGNGAKRLFYGMTNPKANKLIKEIAERVEINKKLTFHDSRDTFGTHAVRKLPITAVQNLMQHSDIRTTKGYLHLSDVERDELLENIKWE
ncbi:MAG: site-specific integrase [Spirosomaceae bacterium]|jgi:integrase|nr:site-specific integrase [Spirosomataceae bacterium]